MTKMTNVMALDFVLTNCTLTDEVKDKLTTMREQFAKKNTAIRKPTATQTENEGFKSEILDFLSTVERATVTEIMAGVPSVGALSNQRASAIVRQLTLSGAVERIEDKRKAYFRIAE